jgi:hypothetical protein
MARAQNPQRNRGRRRPRTERYATQRLDGANLLLMSIGEIAVNLS